VALFRMVYVCCYTRWVHLSSETPTGARRHGRVRGKYIGRVGFPIGKKLEPRDTEIMRVTLFLLRVRTPSDIHRMVVSSQ